MIACHSGAIRPIQTGTEYDLLPLSFSKLVINSQISTDPKVRSIMQHARQRIVGEKWPTFFHLNMLSETLRNFRRELAN